jgi:hypothetical protein
MCPKSTSVWAYFSQLLKDSPQNGICPVAQSSKFISSKWHQQLHVRKLDSTVGWNRGSSVCWLNTWFWIAPPFPIILCSYKCCMDAFGRTFISVNEVHNGSLPQIARPYRRLDTLSLVIVKLEGHGFETRWTECIFSVYLILPAALGPGVYSASNRNEYQKQKNNVSGE